MTILIQKRYKIYETFEKPLLQSRSRVAEPLTPSKENLHH